MATSATRNPIGELGEFVQKLGLGDYTSVFRSTAQQNADLRWRVTLVERTTNRTTFGSYSGTKKNSEHEAARWMLQEMRDNPRESPKSLAREIFETLDKFVRETPTKEQLVDLRDASEKLMVLL
jgi:hypothetical protein